MTRFALFILLAVALAVPVAAQPPKKAEPAATAKPWFVEDDKLFDDFMEKLTDLAKDGKCLANDKLVEKLKPGRKAKLTPAKPGDKTLAPEEVYKHALPSVFVVGSVYKDKDGEWQDGLYATAWVAAATASSSPTGTSSRIWRPTRSSARSTTRERLPVVDFLGGDKVSDVAVFRIEAKGLTPLPVADGYAEIGSWVGVLSHPGDNFYVFTTGAVSRTAPTRTTTGSRSGGWD